MRTLRCAVLVAVILGCLAGSAWSTHDHRAFAAGVWTLDPHGKPGTLRLAVATKAEGMAKLDTMTDGYGGCESNNFCSLDPCQGETASHWYVGSFKTPADHGPVAGCTWAHNSEANLWFKSTCCTGSGGRKVGRIQMAPGGQAACATAPGYGTCYDLAMKFAHHFDGDGSSSDERIIVRKIEGLVKVREPGGQFRPLEAGDVIPCGSEIRTYDQGFALIRLGVNDYGDAAVWAVYRFSAVVLKGERPCGPRVLVGRSRFVDVEKVYGGWVVLTVLGTVYWVGYDPVTKATVVSVEKGRVAVRPKNRRLESVTLRRGQEVEVTPTTESKVAPIGFAGASRGAVSRDRARKLVEHALDRNLGRCRAKATVFTQRSIRKGWRISVRFSGGVRGWGVWKVVRSNLTPANRLAKQVGRACRG